MEGSLPTQAAVNRARIATLDAEVGKLRDRCHILESDRATISVLKRMVEELNEELPILARQAAREAVTEFHERRHASTLSNWRTYAALLSAGTALGALIVGLVLR